MGYENHTHNKAHSADFKKWHAIFVYAKSTPLFATADVRRWAVKIGKS